MRSRPRLALERAALAPAPGAEPLLGPMTAAAEEAGVRPGMRLGEALATCPGLVLVERDPAAVEEEWEGVLRRLEDAGFAVEAVEPGVVVFETKGVERLYGGVEAALRRALAAVGNAWDPRAGAGQRRFAALAAASTARPGQIVIVEGEREREFLAPLPLSLLPLSPDRYAELEGLGDAPARRSRPASGRGRRGAAGAGGAAGVAARTRRGAPPRARAGACGGARRGALLPRGDRERADAAPRLRGAARPPARSPGAGGPAVPQAGALGEARRRRLVAADGDAAGGDRRAQPPARGARAEARRDSGARSSSCASKGSSSPSTRAASSRSCRRRARSSARGCARACARCKASTGTGSVCAVVEVAPWSRIPETRALVVPRDV